MAMARLFRLLAIAGVLMLLVAGLLTWQGEREWPLIIGASAALLILPALHRAHRRSSNWSKEMRDRASSIDP